MYSRFTKIVTRVQPALTSASQNTRINKFLFFYSRRTTPKKNRGLIRFSWKL